MVGPLNDPSTTEVVCMSRLRWMLEIIVRSTEYRYTIYNNLQWERGRREPMQHIRVVHSFGLLEGGLSFPLLGAHPAWSEGGAISVLGRSDPECGECFILFILLFLFSLTIRKERKKDISINYRLILQGYKDVTSPGADHCRLSRLSRVVNMRIDGRPGCANFNLAVESRSKKEKAFSLGTSASGHRWIHAAKRNHGRPPSG